MESKLNRLLQQWPKGAVGTASWLNTHGAYRQLVRGYVASGWLQPLGHGAFLRAGDTASWLGGLYAIQQQPGASVYAAAGTALALKGQGHFLPLGDNMAVHLFSDRRERLPAWFTKHPWGVRILHHCPGLFASSDPTEFTEAQQGEFAVRCSAPERAILELLHLATTNDAITHAVEVMEGLNTLRPPVLQRLLEGCRSVKVKRFFLWAAESAGHEWVKRLEPDRVDLGHGKRQFYRGGEFDRKYQITVPKREANTNV